MRLYAILILSLAFSAGARAVENPAELLATHLREREAMLLQKDPVAALKTRQDQLTELARETHALLDEQTHLERWMRELATDSYYESRLYNSAENIRFHARMIQKLSLQIANDELYALAERITERSVKLAREAQSYWEDSRKNADDLNAVVQENDAITALSLSLVHWVGVHTSLLKNHQKVLNARTAAQRWAKRRKAVPTAVDSPIQEAERALAVGGN